MRCLAEIKTSAIRLGICLVYAQRYDALPVMINLDRRANARSMREAQRYDAQRYDATTLRTVERTREV